MKNRRKWKRLIILLLSLILLISALEKNMLPDGQERNLLSFRFSAARRAEQTGTKEREENAGREWNVEGEEAAGQNGETEQMEKGREDYIKWVDFNVSSEALSFACQTDVTTYGTDCHIDWISLLACTAARYGGEIG